jgi:hypothetical protein
MPNRASKPKRPRDINQLAYQIVQEATTERVDEPEPMSEPEKPAKNPHAQALGRLGGKKGGRVRAERLSPERRREIAKKAAEARWGRHEG